MKLITKTRTIGITLLAIAVLVYLLGRTGWTSLGIASILLIVAPAKHAQAMLDKYTTSFAKWKTIIITTLYDGVYWLLVFGTAYFLQWKIQSKVAASQSQILIAKEQMLDPALLAQSTAGLQNFVYSIFAGIAAAAIFVFSIVGSMLFQRLTASRLRRIML